MSAVRFHCGHQRYLSIIHLGALAMNKLTKFAAGGKDAEPFLLVRLREKKWPEHSLQQTCLATIHLETAS